MTTWLPQAEPGVAPEVPLANAHYVEIHGELDIAVLLAARATLPPNSAEHRPPASLRSAGPTAQRRTRERPRPAETDGSASRIGAVGQRHRVFKWLNV
ncbi:hypothetical protein ACQP2U_30765 [Nocardia sp. CA-084685]|uniref:hypothetical protein n=1 Tax=Nocardia sp. CA-084685 TaxID=3239970 RepID=UPI003D9546F0